MAALCYGYVMAIRRITISVPEDVARRIKQAAGDTPVSGWVTTVVDERLNDEEMNRRWAAFCRDVAPGRSDRRRADAMFDRLTRGVRRRGA